MRVLLLEVPQLLRGILEHAIAQQHDCELLKGASRDFDVSADRAAPPDAVILGVTADEDCTLVPALFARWPSARVMTVMQTGQEATFFEMTPQRRVMGQLTATEILTALRRRVETGLDALPE